MGRMMDTLTTFLNEDDWKFQQPEDKDFVRMGFSGDNGRWTVFARALENNEQILIYSVCPLNCPEDNRAAMAEFLTRANYGMLIGNFEMDFSDGEVRYKTSIDLEDTEVGSSIIKPMIYANVRMMDRYLPGINKLIAGVGEPAQLIAEIEGD